MNTSSTRHKVSSSAIRWHTLSFLAIALCSAFLFSSITLTVSATTYTDEQIKELSDNNITLVKPCASANGTSNFSSICGNTAKEKYWSALRQTFDEVHAAAILGNIIHEGFFSPTLWQYRVVPAGSGKFSDGIKWEDLYNCSNGTCRGAVGSFQIKWSLGPYLQYINGKDPNLLEYFKDPTYSLTGDDALNKIGAADFDKLVQQEVDFVLNAIKKESFQATTTLEEATDWWTENYENCENCCGSADKDHSCEQIALRRASAQKEYDEMKDFSCSGTTTSSTSKRASVNSSQFTLLDGYGNLTFYGPDAASNGGYAGRNGTEAINGGALADGQVARDTRDGGALGFGDVIYIETTPDEGAESSHAHGRYFIVADTGGETAHSAKWDIDVYVDEPNPSALNYPPFGSTTNVKIYKVASGVSWEEYLEKYYDGTGNPNCDITGEDITWIGDSYSTGAQPIIEREFPGISFGGSVNDDDSYIQDCKHVDLDTTCQANPSLNPSGLKVLQKIIDSGSLKPYLVMALGTNNGWDSNMVKKFQDIMSNYPDTKVVFVTSRTTLSDFSDSNNTLKALVDSNNNYYLADWASAYDGQYFGNDSEHPTTNGGYEKWVSLISDALNSAKTCSEDTCFSEESLTNNDIANAALELSWDCGEDKGCHSQGSPPYESTPKYLEAMKQVGYDSSFDTWGPGASCNVFVGTVLRFTNADKNFPYTYAYDQGIYIMSHPEIYEEISFNGSNYEVLQSGDIFVTVGRSGSGGHIWVFIKKGNQYIRADASNGNNGGRTAEHYYRDPIINDGRQYKVFRVKGS